MKQLHKYSMVILTSGIKSSLLSVVLIHCLILEKFTLPSSLNTFNPSTAVSTLAPVLRISACGDTTQGVNRGRTVILSVSVCVEFLTGDGCKSSPSLDNMRQQDLQSFSTETRTWHHILLHYILATKMTRM